MTGPYDDLFDLPHPTSPKHPRMSIIDRAAQFSPFAALTGHEAAIRETARLTDRKVELDEDEKTVLDSKLRILADRLEERATVRITYFQADQRKVGGSYETVDGVVKKIDVFQRIVALEDGKRISIEDIFEIDSPLFTLCIENEANRHPI